MINRLRNKASSEFLDIRRYILERNNTESTSRRVCWYRKRQNYKQPKVCRRRKRTMNFEKTNNKFMIILQTKQPQGTLITLEQIVSKMQKYKYIETIVDQNNDYTEESSRWT